MSVRKSHDGDWYILCDDCGMESDAQVARGIQLDPLSESVFDVAAQGYELHPSRIDLSGREDYCNHDAVAVVNGVCECGARV